MDTQHEQTGGQDALPQGPPHCSLCGHKWKVLLYCLQGSLVPPPPPPPPPPLPLLPLIRYIVTAGMDAQLKVWDCRQYLPMHSFHSRQPAASLSISQCGLVALGYGRVCEVWRDTLSSAEWRGPYLTHRVMGEIHTLQFCPFEDVLGVGHSNGFSSMIVPGEL